MRKALEYIPAVAAFFAVFLGMSQHPKWDSLGRMTSLGWLTVSIGSSAFVGALTLTFLRQKEAVTTVRQKDRIRSIAHAEIRLSIRQLTGFFFILFGEDTAENADSLVPESVEDPDVLRVVHKVDVRSMDRAFPGGTFDVPWSEVLRTNAERATARIDRCLQIYSPYLQPDVLEPLSVVQTGEFLWRLRALNEYVQMNDQVEFLHFPFPGDRHGLDCGYSSFWDSVRRLDVVLQKDAGRLHRRI